MAETPGNDIYNSPVRHEREGIDSKPPVDLKDKVDLGNLDAFIEDLSDREQLILSLRYGLGGEDEHTLEQIGQAIGVSRERVRQLEARALKKIRDSESIHEKENSLEEEVEASFDEARLKLKRLWGSVIGSPDFEKLERAFKAIEQEEAENERLSFLQMFRESRVEIIVEDTLKLKALGRDEPLRLYSYLGEYTQEDADNGRDLGQGFLIEVVPGDQPELDGAWHKYIAVLEISRGKKKKCSWVLLNKAEETVFNYVHKSILGYKPTQNGSADE